MRSVRAAVIDGALQATVRSRRPLMYLDGADRALERPPHVRAASGAAWFAGRVAVVQDDANFIAMVSPETGVVGAWALPAGAGGARLFDAERGNKHDKLDLEAATVILVDAVAYLIGFGSGATPARRRLALVRLANDGVPEARLVDASLLYDALAANEDFSGGSLNIEGVAITDGGWLRLFQRGNGAAREDVTPVNATANVALDWLRALVRGEATSPPQVVGVDQYSLGRVGGHALSFTDAVALPDGAFIYLAAAEDSPNTVDDGPVLGSAIGWIDAEGVARQCMLREPDGALVLDKIEGVVVDLARPQSLWVLTDSDDPAVPSLLLNVQLEGAWPTTLANGETL